MDRSRRLTDGTRWRIFMRFLRLDDLMTSYTNARPGECIAPERPLSGWPTIYSGSVQIPITVAAR